MPRHASHWYRQLTASLSKRATEVGFPQRKCRAPRPLVHKDMHVRPLWQKAKAMTRALRHSGVGTFLASLAPCGASGSCRRTAHCSAPQPAQRQPGPTPPPATIALIRQGPGLACSIPPPVVRRFGKATRKTATQTIASWNAQ